MPHTLNINGQKITAATGDTLIDAALTGDILIPHDCATGQCETCRVHVPWGTVDDATTAYGDTVLACQARVCGDATITFETSPPPQRTGAVVETITPLSDTVVEVAVRMKAPLRHRPGQYAKLAFAGFPPREYSFSARLDGSLEQDQAVFQIKRLRDGRVSTALGNTIRPGHAARLTGPFGSAFLREQEEGEIVLASSGTGFAPIWSLARALVTSRSARPLSIVTGVGKPDDMYMSPALDWLADHGHRDLTVVARKNASGVFKAGSPDEYLPRLTKTSSVHVAGHPSMVERVRQRALTAKAMCYADPFTPSNNRLTFGQRVRDFFVKSHPLATAARI